MLSPQQRQVKMNDSPCPPPSIEMKNIDYMRLQTIVWEAYMEALHASNILRGMYKLMCSSGEFRKKVVENKDLTTVQRTLMAIKEKIDSAEDTLIQSKRKIDNIILLTRLREDVVKICYSQPSAMSSS